MHCDMRFTGREDMLRLSEHTMQTEGSNTEETKGGGDEFGDEGRRLW